jgi:DNA modification methylase
MNRRFIGIEIEKEYFEAAKKRLQSIQHPLFSEEANKPDNKALHLTAIPLPLHSGR